MDAELWGNEKGLRALAGVGPQLLAFSSDRLLGCFVTSPFNCHGTLASKKRPRTQLWPLAAKPQPAHSPLTLRLSFFLRENNS